MFLNIFTRKECYNILYIFVHQGIYFSVQGIRDVLLNTCDKLYFQMTYEIENKK